MSSQKHQNQAVLSRNWQGKKLRTNRMILLGTTTFTCWNRSLDLYVESCVHSRCVNPTEQLINRQMIVIFAQEVISHQLILLRRQVFVGQLFIQQSSLMMMTSQKHQNHAVLSGNWHGERLGTNRIILLGTTTFTSWNMYVSGFIYGVLHKHPHILILVIGFNETVLLIKKDGNSEHQYLRFGWIETNSFLGLKVILCVSQ